MLPKENELQFAATEAARILRPQLEESLQDAAEASGWPAEVVSALTIDFDGTSLAVNYPDELSETIDNLEYGAPYKLPKSVIRPFISRSEPYIKDVLTSVTLDALLEMEEVF
jgi:hypothetical protein